MSEEDGNSPFSATPIALQQAVENPNFYQEVYPPWLLAFLRRLQPFCHSFHHDAATHRLIVRHYLWDGEMSWWSFCKEIIIDFGDLPHLIFVDADASRELEHNFSASPSDLDQILNLFVQSLEGCECQICCHSQENLHRCTAAA